MKLSEVIRRTKFTRRMEKVRRTPEEVVAAFRATTQLVEAAVIVPPAALRDPDDAAVLACAVAAHADFIVSGDKDLLSLGAFEGIPIISAVDAARTLGYRARARASVI